MYPFLKLGTNCCLSSFEASRPETGVKENTYFYFWPESGKGNFVFKKREKEGERERKISAPDASMKPGRRMLCIHSPEHFPSAWLGIIKETSNSWILTWEGMKWNVYNILSFCGVAKGLVSVLSESKHWKEWDIRLEGHREQRQSRWLGLAPVCSATERH